MKPRHTVDAKDSFMTNEEKTENKPSNGRKVAATVVTLAVTFAIGIASTGLTEKINEHIRRKFVKEDENK